MMRRVYNFGAGPAILPVPVLQKASQGVLEIGSSGMSILEISHRSKEYEAIHFGTAERLLRVLGLDADDYDVLFLGGGASLQFAMLPMNFLNGGVADYVHTGEWSGKAMKEARHFGSVNVAASSEEGNFSFIPKDLKLTPGAKYLHITTNNTIEGTEWPELPACTVPLVADASSDILARKLDYSRFTLLYAGAQKNLGPAGVTLVVVRKSFVQEAASDLPAMLSYRVHAKAGSLYNTPPVVAIYIVGLVLAWIEEQGGVGALEAVNRQKAQAVYEALDEFPDVYEPTVKAKEDRSIMNVTFRLRDPSREQEFLQGAADRQMVGLKGHRSVGGFRASMYNAFPLEGALALADYLREFARKGK